MLTVYFLPHYKENGQIFPRKPVDTYEKETDIMDILGLTRDEIDRAIHKNEIIRGKFQIEASLEFLRKKKIAAAIKSCPDGMPLVEVAEVLGCGYDCVYKSIKNAFKRMESSGVSPDDFVRLVVQYKKLKQDSLV